MRKTIKPGGPLAFEVDLIEHTPVGEVRLLRLGPAAEFLVDRDQFQVGKVPGIFFGDGFDEIANAAELLKATSKG